MTQKNDSNLGFFFLLQYQMLIFIDTSPRIHLLLIFTLCQFKDELTFLKLYNTEKRHFLAELSNINAFRRKKKEVD